MLAFIGLKHFKQMMWLFLQRVIGYLYRVSYVYKQEGHSITNLYLLFMPFGRVPQQPPISISYNKLQSNYISLKNILLGVDKAFSNKDW